MQDKEKGPSVDIASIVVQLKLVGCGSTIGSGSNALNISVKINDKSRKFDCINM